MIAVIKNNKGQFWCDFLSVWCEKVEKATIYQIDNLEDYDWGKLPVEIDSHIEDDQYLELMDSSEVENPGYYSWKDESGKRDRVAWVVKKEEN